MWAMSNRNEMGCEEFAGVAAELALGVLTGRERADALAHLERCVTCRETVRQLTMTGEELVGLLPAAEPPAGFETRVLERLGLATPGAAGQALPAPGQAPSPAGQAPSPRGEAPSPAGHGTGARGLGRARRARSARIPAGRTGPGRDTRPGPAGPAQLAGRVRRLLAAAAVAVAVIVGGLGGWGLHAATSSPAPAPLSSGALLTASHQTVGKIFVYNGTSRWLFMSVDLHAGSGTVICQLVSPAGHATTIGSFRLAGGYGSWGSPVSGSHGPLAGARLVTPGGTVLATATF
jgi:hypothetical protein